VTVTLKVTVTCHRQVTKNPEPVAVRDWKDKVQSQAHAGSESKHKAAAAAA
jgi:hypothetical protein